MYFYLIDVLQHFRQIKTNSVMDGMSEFEMVRKIGTGHHGNVYLVASKLNKRLFALKKVERVKFDTDIEHKFDCDSEISLLPTLSHPNVIKTFYTEKNQHESIALLEYAPKGDLYSYKLENFGSVAIPEFMIVRWLCQLCLGLNYLHSKARVLHRDIKTKNILVMENELLKLADFGTAKQLLKHEQFANTAVGTPYYLSPEAIESSKYNNKSDIWGLGCVMFELCTGTKPFQAANLRELINKIVNDPIQELPCHYSPWLRELIALMLQKNSEKRPTAQNILEYSEVRQAFFQLKIKHPEYEEETYPILSLNELKTKKNCQREEGKKIFSGQSLKTAKNEQKEKSIRQEMETQRLNYKVKPIKGKNIESEKFLSKSLKTLIEERKNKNKQ